MTLLALLAWEVLLSGSGDILGVADTCQLAYQQSGLYHLFFMTMSSFVVIGARERKVLRLSPSLILVASSLPLDGYR